MDLSRPYRTVPDARSLITRARSSSGRVCSFSRSNGVATPRQGLALAPQRSFSAGARHMSVCRAAQAPWQEVVDPSSGKAYFWNTATNETRWDRPADAAAASSADPAAATASPAVAAAGRKTNEQLLAEFFDYLLSPSAKFDYPSPSSEFLDIVEASREAIFEGSGCFYDFLNDTIDATKEDVPMDPDWTAKAIFASEAGEAEATAANSRQSEAAAGIAMWKPENMKWNSSVGILTRRQALESIRSRLSNPVLRDANPAF